MNRLAISAIVLFVSTASAGFAGTGWTPQRAAQTIKTMVPLINSSGTWVNLGFAHTAVCTRKPAGWLTCRATLTYGSGTETVTLWARPLGSSLCVSRTGRAVCAPATVPNDPRVCGRGFADGCLIDKAKAMFVQARGAVGVAPSCTPAGPLRFSCTDGTLTKTIAWGAGLRPSVS